jgi:hypothetical protein
MGRMSFRTTAAAQFDCTTVHGVPLPPGVPLTAADHHTPKRRHRDFDGIVVSTKVRELVREPTADGANVATRVLTTPLSPLRAMLAYLLRCKNRLWWP